MQAENSDYVQIASRVRDLMERHGIIERKQSGELARILSLSFSAAYRKLNSASPWTIEQINKVAAHFNESPAALLEAMTENERLPVTGEPHEATLTIGNKAIPCFAWIDGPLVEGQVAELVAIREQGRWHIRDMATTFEGVRYDVEKIEIYPRQIARLTIAVIEDDESTADNITEYLNAIGFNATPYYSTGSAMKAMLNQVFDGYVIDWCIGNETAEDIIKSIRASDHPTAPIILLTGQIEAGNADEVELARLVRRFNVDCKEKPARLHILAAELSKLLNLNQAV